MRRVARIPGARIAILLEALLFTGVAFLLTRLPYRWQRRFYGRPLAVSPAAEAPADAPARVTDDPIAATVRWALAAVQRRLPMDGTCLPHALAGRLMLRRRGYAPTLYIGALRLPGGAVRMHAWLLQDTLPITGAREARGFTVMGVFE